MKEDFTFNKLAKYGLLKEFLKSKLLEEKLKRIELDKNEISLAKNSYMKIFSLKDEDELEKHRVLNYMSIENLFYKMTLHIKVKKYCDMHYGDYINRYYFNNKENLDSISYSLIRVKSYGLCKELYHRIKDDEDDFKEIAKEYSIGIEKQTGGLIGPLSLTKVHPEVQLKLKKSNIKVLHKPFKINNEWILCRLENYKESKLDEKRINSIKSELLDKDIEKELLNIYGKKLKSIF